LTDLGHEARHEGNDGGIVPKLPNQHDHLFHGHLVASPLPQDVFDKTEAFKKKKIFKREDRLKDTKQESEQQKG